MDHLILIQTDPDDAQHIYDPVKIMLDPWALIQIAQNNPTTSEHRRTLVKLLTMPLYTAMSPNTRYVLSKESECMANRIKQQQRSTCHCQRQ